MPVPITASRSTTALPNCLLSSFLRNISLNNLSLAVDTLPLLARHGHRPRSTAVAALLRSCIQEENPFLARRVYSFLSAAGYRRVFNSNTFLCNTLLLFFLHLRRTEDAKHLLDKMPNPNVFSYNAMLSGYAKLGMLNAVRHLFDRMPRRDIVSWNTLLFALARSGSCFEALGIYSGMRRLPNLGFNAHTFSALLAACVRLGELRLLQQVHGQLVHVGFLSNIIVSSSLLDGYAKCGNLDNARRIFDEIPVRDVLMWTALVHGYAKSGDLTAARSLFEEMPEKNSVSWTALVGGYTRKGLMQEALDLFREMIRKDVAPDQFTFSSALCACATASFLKHGKQIHAYVLRTNFNPNAIVLSSLIDMYSKCGDLAGGKCVFHRTPENKRDVVLWNTMMSAVGQHGDGREAIELYEDMIRLGTKPDANSFVVLLTACSHSGLVEEGMQLFKSMSHNYGINPEEDHYLCLVDLLGRAGRLEEAVNWLKESPISSSSQAWNSLLASCKMHRNLELGKEVAENLIKLEPQNSAAYVLLCNMYAADGRWDSVEKVRHEMEGQKVRKEHAASWIEVDRTIHSFGAADQVHLMKDDIYTTLELLVGQMEDDFSIR